MKKTLSVLLALALCLGLLALAPVTASAAIGIQAGVPTFAVNTAAPTIIGFGGKQWAVIGYNGSGVASASGTLTLLLANGSSYGTSAFWATSPFNNEYSGSTLKTAMDNAYNGLPAKARHWPRSARSRYTACLYPCSSASYSDRSARPDTGW